MDWLKHEAPPETIRPWAPVETSLPDPDLLPGWPPLMDRLPGLLAWVREDPCSALTHLLAAASTAAMLGFSAAPFVGGVDCAFGAGFLLVGALLALNSVNMMYSVYVLYHIALYFQIGKELSLAQVTELRLAFRRVRFMVPLGLALYLGTLFRFHTKRGLAADCDALCCAARDPARMAAVLQGQLYSTLLALPTVYAVLYKLHRDPVEEAAVAAKAAAARQHQHSSG